MASSGLHSNGFSLVRAIVGAPESGLDLDRQPAELRQPLGEELLTPTRIYAKDCLALADSCAVRAFAHVTGGGLAANLARVLPPDADAVLERGSWRPLPIFGLLASRGNVATDEMERVFNMGVGMVAIVAREECDHALQLCAARGLPAWLAGQITPGSGHARLTGTHPA
jgi:phosphoribosylformylglycinamidine cyclo-ligase